MRRRPRIRPDGYVRIFEPTHPIANSDGYVLEHRKVLYDAGVMLFADTHVHHKNGNRSDNRIENLEALDASAHHRYHIRERGFVTNRAGTWPLVVERECATCGGSFRPLIRSARFCSRVCANGRPVESSCAHCGEPYRGTGATSRYCAPRCRSAAFRARQAA